MAGHQATTRALRRVLSRTVERVARARELVAEATPRADLFSRCALIEAASLLAEIEIDSAGPATAPAGAEPAPQPQAVEAAA